MHQNIQLKDKTSKIFWKEDNGYSIIHLNKTGLDWIRADRTENLVCLHCQFFLSVIVGLCHIFISVNILVR